MNPAPHACAAGVLAEPKARPMGSPYAVLLPTAQREADGN